MLLKEKNPTFVEDVNVRFEGNVAVVPKPSGDPEEDGSIEVSGTLYTDVIRSATVNTSTTVGDILHFQEKSVPGFLPPQGKVQVYASDTHDSRLFMRNYQGQEIDLNPLQKKGDIMTFNSIDGTTIRLPNGTPDQVLFVDANEGSGIKWQISNKSENIVTEPSDNNIKHLLLENSNILLSPITSTLSTVNFQLVKRKDSAFTIVTPSTFTITESGNYHFNIQVSVGLPDSFTDVANIEMLLQENSSGFATVPGSQTYAMLVGGSNGGESWTTMSTQVVLEVTASTQFRVMIREVNSSNANITIKPNSCFTSVQKIKVDSVDTSEFIYVNGSTQQIITVSPSLVDMSNEVTKTNSLDTLALDKITFDTTGLRHVFGKVTLSSTDLPADGTARIHIVLLKNNTEITTSISECSVVANSNGTQMLNSGYTHAITNFTSGDDLSMKVYIISQSDVAEIVIVQDKCTLGGILYSSNSTPSPVVWEKYDTSLTSLVTLPLRNYLDIPYNVNNIINSNYFYSTVYPGLVKITKPGTYSIFFKTTVHNTSANTLVSGTRLLVHSGYGFQEVESSRTLASIRPGLSQTLFSHQLIHVRGNSLVKLQVLGGDGSMNIIANTTNLLFYRIENTISLFVGDKVFGSYYQYKEEALETLTTSTTLLPIITMESNTVRSGRYRISWQFDWNMSTGGHFFYAELHFNSVKVDEYQQKPTDVLAFRRSNNFIEYTVSSDGIYTTQVLVKVQSSIVSLVTKNIRIELTRVA